MPIYALRRTASNQTLTEFVSLKALETENTRLRQLGQGASVEFVNATWARAWVRRGAHHETALYVNLDGEVRRAGNL